MRDGRGCSRVRMLLLLVRSPRINDEYDSIMVMIMDDEDDDDDDEISVVQYYMK